MSTLFIIIGIVLVLVLIYFFILRPWHLHWGATKHEVELSLPGDNIVLRTDFNATRVISVKSTPEIIWKWIIQIGSERAGWYSIDWIDNAGIKSATEILP